MTHEQSIGDRMIQLLKKYKYPILILLIGIGLLLVSDTGKGSLSEQENLTNEPESFTCYEKEMETRLTEILSRIQGVGRVEVVLTLKQGEASHYLIDRDLSTNIKEEGSTTEQSEKAVIISKGSSYDEPIVTHKDYPLFQGALIVCEGGGDAQIKLQLTQAVAALTNLSSHNITILKMK